MKASEPHLYLHTYFEDKYDAQFPECQGSIPSIIFLKQAFSSLAFPSHRRILPLTLPVAKGNGITQIKRPKSETVVLFPLPPP